jgi:hypothetical protein
MYLHGQNHELGLYTAHVMDNDRDDEFNAKMMMNNDDDGGLSIWGKEAVHMGTRMDITY